MFAIASIWKLIFFKLIHIKVGNNLNLESSFPPKILHIKIFFNYDRKSNPGFLLHSINCFFGLKHNSHFKQLSRKGQLFIPVSLFSLIIVKFIWLISKLWTGIRMPFPSDISYRHSFQTHRFVAIPNQNHTTLTMKNIGLYVEISLVAL